VQAQQSTQETFMRAAAAAAAGAAVMRKQQQTCELLLLLRCVCIIAQLTNGLFSSWLHTAFLRDLAFCDLGWARFAFVIWARI
jgi:hypothetical protein